MTTEQEQRAETMAADLEVRLAAIAEAAKPHGWFDKVPAGVLPPQFRSYVWDFWANIKPGYFGRDGLFHPKNRHTPETVGAYDAIRALLYPA